MAKLTKAQKRAIEGAMESIDSALRFINSDRIVLCRVTEINAQVGHVGNNYRAPAPHRSQEYKGSDDSAWTIHYIRELSPIDKGVGSDLVRLYTAQKILRDMLNDSAA